MSKQKDVMHIIRHDERDQFLGLVDRLEQEADPLREATYEFASAHRNVTARKIGESGVASSPDVEPFERLVGSLRGRLDLPRPGSVLQALRNAELRTAFLAEVGALTAAEVAQIAGSKAKNSAALASRWRSERRIFAVPWGGELLYPVFQFADGEPRPVIARVLEAFGERPSGWEVALWFATPSAYLPSHATPLRRLEDPDAVVAAARAELTAPEF